MGIPGVKHVIVIAAGKGGVGKSTVTVCLAHALKSLGFKVGILDADVYGPSLNKMLSVDLFPSNREDGKILPAKAYGISYIGMGFFTDEEKPAIIRAPRASAYIRQFCQEVIWDGIDYLIVDFPPGTGDIQLSFLQEVTVQGALLVTTPQEVAMLDVAKAFRMLDAMQVPVLGLIENMSYFAHGNEKSYPFGKEGGRRLAEKLGVPLLAKIPIEATISSHLDKGEPLPSSHAKEVFDALAVMLPEQLLEMEKLDAKALKQFELIWSGA